MEVADRFRSTLPLKKTEKPRIWSFKTMLETADKMREMEINQDFVNILRRLLDMHGRLRCAANVAADFVKVGAPLPVVYLFSFVYISCFLFLIAGVIRPVGRITVIVIRPGVQITSPLSGRPAVYLRRYPAAHNGT